MTTTSKTRKIPAPLFAAAGAGDLAYQGLRKLPERVAHLREQLPGQVAHLRERVSEIAPAVSDAVSETNLRADLGRLRGAARRNAANLVAGAQQAGERAAAVYSDLVNRGEKVVGNARTTEVSAEISPAAGTVTASASTTAPPAKKAIAKKTTAAAKPAVKKDGA